MKTWLKFNLFLSIIPDFSHALFCAMAKFGIILIIIAVAAQAWAKPQTDELKVIETPDAIEIHTQADPNAIAQKDTVLADSKFDPLKYTLGPEDAVEISVMRHPEFSGTYPINMEGKLQYKFVGDIDVNGLTKKEMEEKIKSIISNFVISPEINVTILEYRSKVIYVLGEVGAPGKYYMRSENIPLREAVVQAGLPTLSAAMRRCRLVTPDKNGKVRTKSVDLYSILYGGDLRRNIDMRPGDVLYVPATIMAKIIRVINPVTSTVGLAAAGPSDASTARTASRTLVK